MSQPNESNATASEIASMMAPHVLMAEDVIMFLEDDKGNYAPQNIVDCYFFDIRNNPGKYVDPPAPYKVAFCGDTEEEVRAVTEWCRKTWGDEQVKAKYLDMLKPKSN